ENGIARTNAGRGTRGAYWPHGYSSRKRAIAAIGSLIYISVIACSKPPTTSKEDRISLTDAGRIGAKRIWQNGKCCFQCTVATGYSLQRVVVNTSYGSV